MTEPSEFAAAPPTDTAIDLRAWVPELRRAKDTGWTVFDWLALVEEPDLTGCRVTVQLIRPRGPDATYHCRRFHAQVNEGEDIPSLTGLWPGASWHEREAWEMYGVWFDGFTDHTDLGLRPLLLDGLIADTAGPADTADRGPVLPLRKSALLPARTQTPWPGVVEPGESGVEGAARGGRRRMRPLGVPEPDATRSQGLAGRA
ncbi:MAG: NADH-quinone oxidoreductase subunit C [Austwickia sp.]|nr:NADH-quinone oxidoreductase subunit C [Austwickia sp.]MBK8436109.1 NADH-quinone oxidoreductase subunit C [Austwickia sp.]MBK9101789.1 NADH-quinone oxidoreductase subunit C [Austwickia sp.]